MIKIKIECWWTSTESISDRFLKQFLFPHDISKYEFVNQDPDFTIVLGKTDWEKIETPKERTFYFSQEPLWSPNQPKNNIHEYCSKIFISDKRDYPDREEYIETFLPMLYSGRGEMDNRKEWDWSTELKEKNFKKSKKISVILRKDYFSHYNNLVNPLTAKINYEFRTDLGIELSKCKDIDIYGTHWDNNGLNIKGEIWNKHVGLDDYQFSLSCENSIQKNYVSEKFWDVILTDTVPIYLGCNNITDYISEDFFVNLNGKSMDEIVYIVNNILNNSDFYYEKYKKNISELKKDFFTNPTFNLWERIKQIVI
jgi:hypothetical protein